MFYRAALGLPFFAWGAVFTGGGALSLGGASASVSASAPAAAAVAAAAGVAVPRLYLLLAGNVVGDYCCKVSVPAPLRLLCGPTPRHLPVVAQPPILLQPMLQPHPTPPVAAPPQGEHDEARGGGLRTRRHDGDHAAALRLARLQRDRALARLPPRRASASWRSAPSATLVRRAPAPWERVRSRSRRRSTSRSCVLYSLLLQI